MTHDKKEVSLLIEVLERKGVSHVVCSPGSRNAPLLTEVAQRPTLHKHVVVDERSAAFIALGIASASRRPVALICTSGTALLNYAPAIAEAYYQGVSLVVVSADRPTEWIDQDDSQTLRQTDVFHNFCKASYDISAGSGDSDYEWYVERIANEGMIKTVEGKPGPVHFNVRLAPPLSTVAPRVENVRTIELMGKERLVSDTDICRLAEMAKGKKILLVGGFMPPDKDTRRAVERFASLPQTAVMAETISNLGLPAECYMVDSMLCALSENEKQQIAPDIVISTGGSLVSRMLKEYLRSLSHIQHWSVGYSPVLADCFRHLSIKIESAAADFLTRFASAISHTDQDSQPQYSALMHRMRETARQRKKTDTGETWCDMKAYDIVLNAIPSDATLFLSNGTSIRYAQIIPVARHPESYCNRGVSGIDGSTSTAIGGALANNGRLTVLVTGDMSFAYDIGALGTRMAPPWMRIIVISNGGGGIFRFIASTSGLPQREQYFCADPHTPIKELAAAYGWQYFEATDALSLRE